MIDGLVLVYISLETSSITQYDSTKNGKRHTCLVVKKPKDAGTAAFLIPTEKEQKRRNEKKKRIDSRKER